MHRYSPAGGGNSSAGNVAGGHPRDTSRAESVYPVSSNFATSRRLLQPAPYKLKCDREPLNSRLGPAEFYPPTPNCAEESLSRESFQNGYKEIIDGIEESKEAFLSLAATNNLWTKSNIIRYKESIRKRLRALNEAHVRKRKAGQVYGVPLAGPLLAKLGCFPEQRTCSEDYRKKWIEDLSLRKKLHLLADHVPHGYRRRTLFEALIRHNVPILRATWFIKVMYLNQIRPASIGMAAGGIDKSQIKRQELWTKDFLEYAQSLLDEAFQNGAVAAGSSGTTSQGGEGVQGHSDNAELDMHAKWRYIMRLLQWHCADGLLARSQVVDWALKQIQDKDSAEVLDLLLPVILDSVDSICMSQTHVRLIVDMCLLWLRKLTAACAVPNGNTRSLLLHISTCLTELLRYLLVAVPDTFVSIDCFPLPPAVCSVKIGLYLDPAQEKVISKNQEESKSSLIASVPTSANDMNGPEVKSLVDVNLERKSESDSNLPLREVIIQETVELIQKRAATLAKAVSPDILYSNEGKVVQDLDNALVSGDIVKAYYSLFDGYFCSFDPSLSMSIVGRSDLSNLFSANVNASEFCAVKFLCEWATCNFRDSRGVPRATDKKPTVGKEMSRVFMAVSILRFRLADKKFCNDHSNQCHSGGEIDDSDIEPNIKNLHCKFEKEAALSGYLVSDPKSRPPSDSFLRRCRIHDLIIAWIDHHELHKNQGFDRFVLLLTELINEGLFRPDAYVRRLLLDGILERNVTETDIKRAAKHRRILRHLPGPPFLSVDGCKGFDPLLFEAARQFQNERRLALAGVGCSRHRRLRGGLKGSSPSGRCLDSHGDSYAQADLNANHDERKMSSNLSDPRKQLEVERLKQALCKLLQLPECCLGQHSKFAEEKGNGGNKSFKRHSMSSSIEKWTGTPGCEECVRRKRQKANEEKGWFSPGSLTVSMEQEDTWWLKKGPKAVKLEPPVKPSKQTIRGRPKTVRKTQSLAQLANPRMDGNQGASSVQATDNKVACPYHQSSLPPISQTEPSKSGRVSQGSDLRAIGSAIRHLRLVEKRSLSSWLVNVVQSLVDKGGKLSTGAEKDACLSSQSGAGCENAVRWRLTDEHLVSIVYLLDLSLDFQSILRLLLWLLPLAAIPVGALVGQNSRNISGLVQLKESSFQCDVGEATILSCLRRYENILIASNFLPQALSAGMRRASNVMAATPGGRAVCSLVLGYVRDLLRKYGGLAPVQTWEKDWRRTCDQRLTAELDALKAGDSEGGFNLIGLTDAGVADDRDDPPPQKPSGRLSRVVASMKEIVHTGLSEAIRQIVNREHVSPLNSYDACIDRPEELHFSVQRVVSGLMDLIRQNAGGGPQADSLLVAAAVTALVNHAATAAVNALDSTSLASNFAGSGTTLSPFLSSARRVIQVHIDCLRVLKEALGERHGRALESALTSEASSLMSGALGLAPGRPPRSQFHMSPETPETAPTLATTDAGSTPSSTTLGRATTGATAVACLVIFCILQGITSLEKIVTVLRLKDGLEALQLAKYSFSSSNGITRMPVTGNTLKVDNVAEAHVYWFRVLIGDCRHVAAGLVADLLGDANVRAFARLQSLMPLATVFSPTYALFSAAVRRQQLLYISTSSREDPVLVTLIPALSDIFSHDPFRDACFRDTRQLYQLLSSASGDSDYASFLDVQGFSSSSKAEALVPLCATLFLHSLLDRELPACLQVQDTDYWSHVQRDKSAHLNEKPKMEQLVQILDELQPATFHWQWVELRLLLNELALVEKIEGNSMSAGDAIQTVQAVAACSDSGQLSECEKSFISLVLTRLLVRPDAASLYSEAVHCLGSALEEFLIVNAKWILDSNEMLLGRKSLGQLLETFANSKGYSVSIKQVKYWEPLHLHEGSKVGRADSQKQQAGAASPEEGEFSEAFDLKRWELKGTNMYSSSDEAFDSPNHFATEKALADLVLPCLKRSSNGTCNGFAAGLVKQLSNLEQHITLITRTSGKPLPGHSSTSEALAGKGQGSRRKSGLEAGSPGLGRRPLVPVGESSPVSAAALQSSMWLRLQFLLPLLPMIYSDRESTASNMRITLAPVLFRLLGTRVVHETEQFGLFHQKQNASSRDLEFKAEAAAASASALAGEGLFDRLLSVVHALLSGCWVVWLKPQSSGKGITKSREFPPFEKEAAERLQIELDHMQLPNTIRQRLQAAMPYFPPCLTHTISAAPPQLLPAPVTASQSVSNSQSSISNLVAAQKQPPTLENAIGKVMTPAYQERELEMDPWTLLEDGACSSISSSGNVGATSTDTGNVRACSWLKGAVRVRRTNMTYVGAVDDT